MNTHFNAVFHRGVSFELLFNTLTSQHPVLGNLPIPVTRVKYEIFYVAINMDPGIDGRIV